MSFDRKFPRALPVRTGAVALIYDGGNHAGNSISAKLS